MAHADTFAATSTPTQSPAPGAQTYLSPDELVERIRAYNPAADEDLIRRAYAYCVESHGEQRRHSGDPYYSHPVAVAEILTELHLDAGSIVTALLHDVVEDTDATHADVAAMFGQEVADLVDGVTKLGQVELNSARTEQAENLQKFVLAITQDVRVLLVKLSDRLHNMRTLHHHPRAASRERIARETADIYAPLARRIGVERLSAELEDLSFQHLNPGAYDSIRARLEQLRVESAEAVSEVSYAVTQQLEDSGIPAVVYGREKRPYSIWRKLQRKSVGFAELADVYGFRVLVDSEEDCYRALGAIHLRWRYTPDRFRDYISVPKPNNYRSLHTTVMGPAQTRVELQIRTHTMHEVAERGVAAHWRYKDNSYKFDPDAAEAAGGDPLDRLRPFVEILEHGGDPEEFLEHAKMEMFQDQVFTFTPKGKLIPLPQGAMPLDFAYAIHTEIGDTAVGAIINGRERPLSTPLHNADVVEIVRAGAPRPPANWRQLVVTGRARSAIRRLVRQTESEEFAKIGRSIAESSFRREGKEYRKANLEDALNRLGLRNEWALFIELGRGRITGPQLVEAVYPGRKDSKRAKKKRALIRDGKAQLYVRGKTKALTPGVTLDFARCCSPLPGDRIVGILQPEVGVEVHTIDCENLERYEDEPERWVDLDWTPKAESDSMAIGRVNLTVLHEPGALAEIAQVVGENNGNIANIRTASRSTDFIDMQMDVEVVDAKHLSHLIAALRACRPVASAKRAKDNLK